MANNIQPITTLHNLLDYDTQNFIIGEVKLKTVLHEWINKASSLKLKVVLQKYLDFVQQHVEKMEDFIEEEKIASLSLTNRVMQAMIEDTEEKMNNCADTEIRDACMLACIQVINHFKISTYGTAAVFAKTLGMEKTASLFHEAEVNEKQIDDRLSQLAKFEINNSANIPIVLPG